MTLLISWIGVDSRKPTSIYLASDSRISWGDTNIFDQGRKLFGCMQHPEIFGYCGDVLFPSIVLNQLVSIIDHGMLLNEDWPCEIKFEAIFNKLKMLFDKYPYNLNNITANSIEIIHASRDKQKKFFCKKIKWDKMTNVWQTGDVSFNDHSNKLFVLGSGRPEYLKKFNVYWASDNTRTSRAVFHCFCDALFNIHDIYCGGAPQLIGLYEIGNARYFGIIKDRKRYFQGSEADDLINYNNIDWRNELFERCDGNTMNIKPKAQRQPNCVKY